VAKNLTPPESVSPLIAGISPTVSVEKTPPKQPPTGGTDTSQEIGYYINDELEKYKLITPKTITVGEFREKVMKKHKNKLTQEWAVFSPSVKEDQRLVILKEDQLLSPGGVYYIIFNSAVQVMCKKLQKKTKKRARRGHTAYSRRTSCLYKRQPSYKGGLCSGRRTLHVFCRETWTLHGTGTYKKKTTTRLGT